MSAEDIFSARSGLHEFIVLPGIGRHDLIVQEPSEPLSTSEPDAGVAPGP